MKTAGAILRGVALSLLLAASASTGCELVAGVEDVLPAACDPGEERSCYSGPAETENIGACEAGTQTCNQDVSGFDACVGEVLPVVEDCTNETDDDCSGLACAQAIWAKSLDTEGGQESQFLVGLAVDAQSNTYLSGFFEGNADLGGGPLTSDGTRTLYLAKMAPDGAHLWSKSFGAGGLGKIALLRVSSKGVVVAVELQNGTVDFGDGPLGPGGTVVAALDAEGKSLWSRRLEGQLGPRGFAMDPATGAVVVAGGFSGSVDFGPGGVLVSQGDSTDVFVVKLDSTGGVVWARAFGDSDPVRAATQQAWAVAVAPTSDIVISGPFDGAMSMGGAVLDSSGPAAVFVAALDSGGEPRWAQGFSDLDTQSVQPFALAAPAGGGVLIGGSFAGKLGFGGTPGETEVGDPGDAFIAKLDSKGKYAWARFFAGDGVQQVFDVATDTEGNVVTIGAFFGTADFGTGPVESAGDADVFVLKLTPTGENLWNRTPGSAAALQIGTGVAIDPVDQSIRVVGVNNGVLDFGFGLEPVTAASDIDVFLAKIAP